MDKKENQPREKKGMPLAPVFLLGATVLLLIEMYFIVNLPRLYLVQIILGAAILACTYVFIAALLKEIHKSGEQAKDEYERMLRGEKASYLMLKKSRSSWRRLTAIPESRVRRSSQRRRRLPR